MTAAPNLHLRLLLVDDHEMVLQGLRTLLAGAHGLIVVAEAQNGDEALKLHEIHRPDITLLDIRMPGMDGIQVLHSLRKQSPQAHVIMLAAEDFQADLLRAWQQGASGFLLKTASRSELLDAIFHVYQHGWCNPFKPGYHPLGSDSASTLSCRELEVLDYVSRGLSNGDIALALAITEHTIKAHLKTIFMKLGCGDRTEAVVAAFEHGLLRVSPNQTEVAQPPK